jgi:hypothetical protein
MKKKSVQVPLNLVGAKRGHVSRGGLVTGLMLREKTKGNSRVEHRVVVADRQMKGKGVEEVGKSNYNKRKKEACVVEEVKDGSGGTKRVKVIRTKEKENVDMSNDDDDDVVIVEVRKSRTIKNNKNDNGNDKKLTSSTEKTLEKRLENDTKKDKKNEEKEEEEEIRLVRRRRRNGKEEYKEGDDEDEEENEMMDVIYEDDELTTSNLVDLKVLPEYFHFGTIRNLSRFIPPIQVPESQMLPGTVAVPPGSSLCTTCVKKRRGRAIYFQFVAAEDETLVILTLERKPDVHFLMPFASLQVPFFRRSSILSIEQGGRNGQVLIYDGGS